MTQALAGGTPAAAAPLDASLQVACCRLNLRVPSPYRSLLDGPAYLPFVAQPGRSDACLRLVQVDLSELDPAWEEIGERRGEPFAERPIFNCSIVAQRYRLRRDDELLLLGPAMVSFLDPSIWIMECFTFEPSDPVRLARSQLVCLLSSLLAATRGLLLHGSGFVIDGVAAAVIGPSDAGKTTAARLVQGDRLLSDDMVAVTDIDGQPQLHATPFGRESDGIDSAPLRAIFFPRKQATFSLRPLSAREALIRSAAEQADTFQGLFNPYDGMSIRNLARLFRKVPAYELGFSLDGIDREAIRRVLSGSQDPE
jgi:hypothetical protein